MLVAFFQAQHINTHAGGAVIAPWDLLEGHDLAEWAETAIMLSDVPAKRRRHKAQQEVFEKARRAHPNYSTYH